MDLIEFLFGKSEEKLDQEIPIEDKKEKIEKDPYDYTVKQHIKIKADNKQEAKNNKTHTEELRPKREDEQNAD